MRDIRLRQKFVRTMNLLGRVPVERGHYWETHQSPRQRPKEESLRDRGAIRLWGLNRERLASRRLTQQLLDFLSHDFFAFIAFPIQFAVPPVTNATLSIDQVDAGPHAIAPVVPDGFVGIDHDGKCELRFRHLLTHVFRLRFRFGFGCVDTDDNKILVTKRLFPTPVPGVIAVAIHSPIGPEMDRHDFTTQLLNP